MRLRPSGTAAVLVECEDLDGVLATYAAVRAAVDGDLVPGAVDVVPAARTVLVVLDPRTSTPEEVGGALERLDVGTADAVDEEDADVLEVPVHYDGDDLADVAGILGCGPDDVVERHTNGLWTVAFCGFAPGFGYLTADEGTWDVPRRESPRTKVPRGSVALAGEFTGVYPRSSPGGWQLIGRTDLDVFDLDRDPPALLAPRRRVRFVVAS
ncbi:5-oxoprolinase subunit B family protein [Nocardioides coralli]|uniref:5-oxoprolinase subunit B family protein n=1 Tax=Nocardioides coralli TaxID=2872154 RepID=UPI001CA3FF24|nr:allophanate hydrolase subunit 1 [Nocardioides coralli]QZY29211.1 allophanate hydrolase subunit 1 [Nocardioides coralli]